MCWRVEAFDDDGGIDVNIFSGGDAKERAIEFAAWRYGVTYREPLARADKEEPSGLTEHFRAMRRTLSSTTLRPGITGVITLI